ncbi:MAG: glycosyltransferase family 2 protein [Bacteroidales bacterium]|nr:glycosyltransferase family 2 protein [Bacteroidales bacterium]
MPAVSVIISVYNVEPYMARCARSLFGQTLRDMEFVFVDDCTPDRSVEVMKEVLEEFPDRKSQVKVFRMPCNSGQALVRMKGLELATGDYLAHCDADDWVGADAYEKAYGKALSGGFDIVTFNFRKGSDGNWVNCSSGSLPGKELSDIMTGTVMGSLWCRLFKRSLADGLALPAGNMAEDMALSIQMTAKAKKIGHLDAVLYSYFVRPDSISHSSGMEAALARQESMYANTRLCTGLLQPYADKYSAADMLIFKYRSRHYLEPYVHHKAVYRKWRNTFPEVDGELLGARGISLETKFWYILIRLHLYHPWKVLSGKL